MGKRESTVSGSFDIGEEMRHLRGQIAYIDREGCGHRRGEEERYKRVEIDLRELKHDVKWLIRLALVTLLGVVGTLVYPLLVRGFPVAP